MDLVYIAPAYSDFTSRSANSIHIMRMCEAFAQNGHKTSLVLFSRGERREQVFENYGIEPSFEIRQVKAAGKRCEKLRYSLMASSTAVALRPDIVVGRSTEACALSAIRGISTVYDAHKPVWEKTRELVFYLLLCRNRNLLRMTTNSRALKEIFEKARLSPHCGITVANNGSLVLPLDEIPPDWPGREDAFQVGYVGHLYAGRGVEIIVSVAGTMPEVDFHVVGGNEADIERWKSAVNMPNLFFHGFIRHADVYRYRNRCDVLLAPYQEKVGLAGGGDQGKYMNPIKIFEYMSSRKAIVCSDLPVLREILEQGRNSILCAPGDAGEWREAIERLRKDGPLRQGLAEAAYEDFLQGYTWKARAEKMIEGLEQRPGRNSRQRSREWVSQGRS